MKPPICAICDREFSPSEGGLIYFQETEEEKRANERFLEPGFVGHPSHAVWFCPEHYPLARTFSQLTRREAMQKIQSALQSSGGSAARDPFLQAAIDEARKGAAEGGIPIGSVLVRDSRIIGRGHNQRVQKESPILHGEMDCLQNAGRQTSYSDATIYSTLMPCYMCAGTIVQFGIPRVVVAESRNFPGARSFMESHGIEVIDLDDSECIQMMQEFIEKNPDLWSEDIAE